MKELPQTLVFEIASHFWIVSFLWVKISCKVDYTVMSLIPFSYLGLTNEMSVAPGMVQREVIYNRKLSEPCYKTMMQPVQKRLNKLPDI